MPEREQYDRSAKWLLQHHGDSILRLGGVGPVRAWRALQTDLVHPRRLPDGLLEVTLADSVEPDLFLIEMATYPERRISDQIADDIALVRLERHVLPEVLTIVLASRGNLSVDSAHETTSRHGWTRLAVAWRVVELWNLPADQLLAENDVGLIPWVPLTRLGQPPSIVLQECRRRIDHQAAGPEHANLLAVTQVLTGLRYNDPQLLKLLGGRQAMIESPVLLELLAETRHRDILRFLSVRFGPVPADITSVLQSIRDQTKLDEIVEWASLSPNLEEFRDRLGHG